MAVQSIRNFSAAPRERVSGNGLARSAAALARTVPLAWRRDVLRPLHALVDACLLSDDLRALNAPTLRDVGLHRERRPGS